MSQKRYATEAGIILNTAIIKHSESTTRCEQPHTLKVLRNPRGGYHVTCEYCDWWSSIPAGERLKGWEDRP